MSKSPFWKYAPNYTLTFEDGGGYQQDAYGNILYDPDGEPLPAVSDSFSVEAQLIAKADNEKKRLGFDSSEMVVTVAFTNPKEGDPRIKHNTRCTVSPDFNGLTGTLVFKGEPDADFHKVKQVLGVAMTAVFEESVNG